MNRYDLYLFLHIAAAVIWVGGGFMIVVMATLAERTREENRLAVMFVQVGEVVHRVIVPSSIAVLILGILMVVDGPWSFSSLWLVLGLLGFLATFVTGLFVMTPWAERIETAMERDGERLTPEVATEIRKLLTLARVDTLVLFLVVADMAIKPTGDDVGVLAVMAALLVAGLGFVAMRMRALGQTATPAVAAPASPG